MNEIIEIDGHSVKASPLVAWAHHEEKRLAGSKRKAVEDKCDCQMGETCDFCNPNP